MTIDTNKEAIPIEELYNNIGTLSPDVLSTPAVLSFLYHNGSDCSVLVAMAKGRYRVQSSSMEGLRIVGEDLLNRLRRILNEKYERELEEKGGEEEDLEPVVIKTNDPIPYGAFFVVLDEHYNLRQQLRECVEEMGKKANLVKAIEKRLLVRCKEKSVSSLSNMDVFFELVMKEQLDLIARACYLYEKLTISSSRLDNALAVLLFVAQLNLCLEGSELLICKSLFQSPLSFLSPLNLSIEYSSEDNLISKGSGGSSSSSSSSSTGGASSTLIVGGWEETIQASLLRTMKTQFKKSGEMNAKIETGTIGTFLEFPSNTSQLKNIMVV